MGNEEAWVGQTEAETISGVSRRTLARLVEAGRLRRQKLDGVWKYAVADLENIAGAAADTANDSEVLLGQAYQFINTMVGPHRQFVEMILEMNRELRERVKHLEARHDEVLTSKEEFLNQQLERDLLLHQATKKEERKDKALGLAWKSLPMLMGAKGAQAAGIKLIQSLNDEQVMMLMNTEITTDEQKELLRSVLNVTDAPAESEAEKEEANES